MITAETTVRSLQRSIVTILAVLWSLIGLPGPESWALDTESARATLKGLSGVRVLIDLTPDAERAGLTMVQLQTDVELRLRQAGIAVLTKEEWHSSPGQPWLWVQVTTLRTATGLSAYHIGVELNQNVFLERNSSPSDASTWSTAGITGIVGAAKFPTLRDDVKDEVDRFINAYLSVNPRPAGSAAPSSMSVRRDLVRQVQERLQAVGFKPGGIDGALGPQTREALQWFQNTKGLLPTGEIDEKTLDALEVR